MTVPFLFLPLEADILKEVTIKIAKHLSLELCNGGALSNAYYAKTFANLKFFVYTQHSAHSAKT